MQTRFAELFLTAFSVEFMYEVDFINYSIIN